MNGIKKEMIEIMASLMRKLKLNPKEQICLDELTKRRIEVHIKKAKKEVFDDIDKYALKFNIEDYDKTKKHHRSPSAETNEEKQR